MISCLQLGAADYMIKPLRHNELRNLWARVYWWRRVRLLASPSGRACCMANNVPAPLHGLSSNVYTVGVQAFYLQQQAFVTACQPEKTGLRLHYYNSASHSSGDSEETKW